MPQTEILYFIFTIRSHAYAITYKSDRILERKNNNLLLKIFVVAVM